MERVKAAMKRQWEGTNGQSIGSAEIALQLFPYQAKCHSY